MGVCVCRHPPLLRSNTEKCVRTVCARNIFRQSPEHLFFWPGLILEGVKKKTVWAPCTCRGHVTKAVPAAKEGQARRGEARILFI